MHEYSCHSHVSCNCVSLQIDITQKYTGQNQLKQLILSMPMSYMQLLPSNLTSAAVELLPYILDSFGNATRIDYGTGHETAFVAFLHCLAVLGLVTESDRQALVCTVFNRQVAAIW